MQHLMYIRRVRNCTSPAINSLNAIGVYICICLSLLPVSAIGVFIHQHYNRAITKG